ncbi:hypothetical protein J2X72_004634 [Phyllobacterium sp. 1468]|uniref:hypothetical protein n=1 Tax=Phyllobacterium sp. 1468 TaxID=2817759 RepID=UPI00285DE2F7|nr:hypothetical protein [Phyllobacterium sp. 1468]MDR6635820.1 hypothetical protein [Phyllobacterium sp. 1468]
MERLENGWLNTADPNSVISITTIDWATAGHQPAVNITRLVPANGVLDRDHRHENLPVLDARLGSTGLRLVETLNDAFAPNRRTLGQE